MRSQRILRSILSLALAFVVLTGTLAIAGCGGDGKDPVREFKVNLKKTAEALNAVAKANRALSVSLGEQYLQTRIKVATGVHQANEYVIAGLDFAKDLTKANFPQNKAQALLFMQNALNAIRTVKIGKPEVDLVIDSVVSLINTGISIVTTLTSKAIKVIHKIDIPEVQDYFKVYTFEYTQEAAGVWTN